LQRILLAISPNSFFPPIPPSQGMSSRLLAAALAVVALTGCLSNGTLPDSGDDASSRSVGVVIFNQSYEAGAQDAEFTVGIPDDATDLRFEVSQDVNHGGSATVKLSNCGSGEATWTPGGDAWQRGSLCAKGQRGPAMLTVHAGSVPISGRVLLRADLR
jgi:hypothetical protein